MLSKHLERTIKFNAAEFSSEITCPYKLEYYITVSEIEEQEELNGVRVYGIEVVKLNGEFEVEREIVKNFCCSEITARNTISLLADHAVTPIELQSVLENLIAM